MISPSPETLKTARLGFDRFKHGLATGEWEAFLEMLTDDFTFFFPAGPYKGLNYGPEKLGEFLRYATEKVFPGGLVLNEERISGGDTTVIFEARSRGKMWGNPYENQVAIALEIRGDRICGYREYLAIAFTLPAEK
ncbi:nuclear transport factor 2 family protein [Lyngbya sp. CCY1209]|uniref:nuclear transport factor 2 family protein n=1 Tax=Lyngbya sp. CCY1209 TaxID=2886103 RepID=UPI002D202F19|nr:nuclear transport factor 2 family protein [Lyngbya sp. CCY1209]MEB3884869.1 nuclear transport factor 2 family protein [Lyngbya sp. CCY1209]